MTARVNRGLTPARRRRPAREVSNTEYLGFLRRCLRAYRRRVGSGASLTDLADLASLRDEIDGHVIDAIAELRHDPVWPASWGQIGRALGISRQAAQARYGKVGGSRRPGGQPGEWR